MGYLDDMKVFLGKGVDAADRKAQELRLQADLSRIDASLEAAYSALGKIVYSHPTLAARVQQDCPGEYKVVAALLEEKQGVHDAMDNLRRQAAAAAAPVQGHMMSLPCPKCGSSVSLDLSYCQNCGDNLVELKARYRTCPTCGTYCGPDSTFCIYCGSRTIELAVAPALRREVADDEFGSKKDAEELWQDDSQPSGEGDDKHESSESETLTDSNDYVSPEIVPSEVVPEEVPDESAPPQVESVVVLVEQETISSDLTCPFCGSVVKAGDAFCGECGAKLVD